MVTLDAGDRARHAGDERGQACARAGGQVETGQRHLHRARGDVDDAAEFPGGHRIDDLLGKLDRDHHVGDHAIHHLRPRELAEIPERGARVVVHQDVRLRTGAQQRRLAFGGGDVGLHGGHLGAGCLAKLGRGLLQRLAVPPIDGHVAARFRQRARTGAAEPAARGTDDGLAAGNSEIHGMSDG